jgi:lipopolysaccharide transport system ATP-binding protein
MQMRLAFAIAAHIRPEILLIDEVLAVGDLAFQRKCLDRIAQFKQVGCAILLVSTIYRWWNSVR